MGSFFSSAAIIGAGIGGSSASYFLQKKFDGNEKVDITIFESGVVGGRLATINIAGHTYESGGSIIHPANVEMNVLVEKLGNTYTFKNLLVFYNAIFLI